jgi:hypothetical protein
MAKTEGFAYLHGDMGLTSDDNSKRYIGSSIEKAENRRIFRQPFKFYGSIFLKFMAVDLAMASRHYHHITITHGRLNCLYSIPLLIVMRS